MKEIETNGKTILFVEIAPDATNFRISKGVFPDLPSGDLFYDTKLNVFNTGNAIIPPGNWQILGKSTELSEEQMKEICDFHYMQGENGEPDYLLWFDHVKDCYHLNTSNESYLSLLEANGIVDRNPHGEFEPQRMVPFYGPGRYSENDLWRLEKYHKERMLWQEAQSKVKTYLILIKN